MADVKTTTARPGNPQGGQMAGKPKSSSNFLVNLIIVIACIAAGELIYYFVFGRSSNFKHKEMHSPANFFGTMYSGGFIVPILMATAFTLLCFVFERALTIFKARGSMNAGEFVR